MLSIIGFMAILGPLVIVHEFGHYLFARLFNVRAEVFSIGFGPRIIGRQIGETEWRLSAFPLGGYVKLFGEDPQAEITEAESARALQKQAPWKRFFIFFGGPLFNFLFAIFVFMTILVLGESHPASVLGRIVEGSPAEKIGFRSGDLVIAINGIEVKRFDEVLTKVSESPGKEIKFKIRREASGQMQELDLSAAPAPQEGYSVYGEATHVGEIDGILVNPRSTQIGISAPASIAAKMGLATGDEIVKWSDREVSTWEELVSLYSGLKVGETARILVKKKSGSQIQEVKLTRLQEGTGQMETEWGFYSTELFVDKTVKGSPAETAGLKYGDRIVRVGGKAVKSFFELKDGVQRSGEKGGPVELEWERDGQILKSAIVPTSAQTRDPFLKKVTQYTIGVMPMISWAEPKMVIERTFNPFSLVYKGTERMLTVTWRNVVSIRKMITGDVSVAALGGPIMIGKIAGESLSRGFVAFLTTMALLSVGLGVLNILPIPVLDGGHLMLLGIESIRRKPLTVRQMEVIQQVGLSLILLLMVVVFKNDLARLSLFQ